MQKVLFICLGNICRSPTAEIVFSSLVEKQGLSGLIGCDSAGTAGYHIGEKADRRSIRMASLSGYEITHRARQFSPAKDFDAFDYIVTMDDSNYRDVLRMAKKEEHSAKILKCSEFLLQSGYHEVPDPYYGGEADFKLVVALCEEAAENLLEYVKERIPKN